MTEYKLGDEIEVPAKEAKDLAAIYESMKELELAAETLAKQAASHVKYFWRGIREAVPDLPDDRALTAIPKDGKLIVRVGPEHQGDRRLNWGDLFIALEKIKRGSIDAE